MCNYRPTQNMLRKEGIIKQLENINAKLATLPESEKTRQIISKIDKVIADKKREIVELANKCNTLVEELERLSSGLRTDLDEVAIEQCIRDLEQFIEQSVIREDVAGSDRTRRPE